MPDDTPAKAAPKPRAARSKTTATTARPKAKSAVAAPAPAPAPVAVAAAAVSPVVVTAGPVLKKKDLLERVIKAAGGKKKDVKEIVEATLAVLGDALSKGEELNLPPLGRAKVNRQKDMPSGEMMVIKLRRGGEKPEADAKGPAKKSAKEALAEAED